MSACCLDIVYDRPSLVLSVDGVRLVFVKLMTPHGLVQNVDCRGAPQARDLSESDTQPDLPGPLSSTWIASSARPNNLRPFFSAGVGQGCGHTQNTNETLKAAG